MIRSETSKSTAMVRRDWELIREILLGVEERCGPAMINADELRRVSVDRENFNHQVGLVEQAGLLEADSMQACDAVWWLVRGLTALGRDFVDAVRADWRWARAKDRVIAPMAGAPVAQVVREVIQRFIVDTSLL